MSSNPSQSTEHQQLSVSSPNANFHSVLLNVIESTKDDPAYLRSLVYELARIKLTKEAWRNPSLKHTELRTHLRALETAIDDVETVSAREEQIRAILSTYQAQSRLETRPTAAIEVLEPQPGGRGNFTYVPLIPDPAQGATTRSRDVWSAAAPMLRLLGVVVVGIFICVVIAARYDLYPFVSLAAVDGALRHRGVIRPEIKEAPVGSIAERPAEPLVGTKPAVQTQAPAFPLPTSFGVYALSGGQLSQLETLPGRVPDQRVAVGPLINKPAQTTLSDGRLAFIVFRRDLVANAPEKVSVRVVARIARAMTFEAGKPNTANLEATWAVRSKAYDFKVAPLSENQEMIIIRPESEDLSLPAGRYALVLKGQSYDFSIAGPISDRDQCLERVDALNGTIYSECRKP